MIKVYTDVTCYLNTGFTSGIQRVVMEVLSRMLKNPEIELITLSYNQDAKRFQKIDADSAVRKKKKLHPMTLDLGEMEAGDVFFEIDASWNVAPRRAIFYPELKKQGVKIITFIQDILPVTHPEYFGMLGNWAFLGYIAACIGYADEIVVTTEATRSSFQNLMMQIQSEIRPIHVVGLGGDLRENRAESNPENVDKSALEFVKDHDGYVFMAGTIEPRKNHIVVLDAFEHGLLVENIPLVIAGRVGWNSEAVVERIHRLESNPNFIFLEQKNNATIRYLYQHAKIVAFPSFDEGYGLPIIEAMSYGVPVIAGNVPVLCEVGGDACMYCDVDASNQWENTIRAIYQDKENYQQWKSRAEKFKPLTWDEVECVLSARIVDVASI